MKMELTTSEHEHILYILKDWGTVVCENNVWDEVNLSEEQWEAIMEKFEGKRK